MTVVIYAGDAGVFKICSACGGVKMALEFGKDISRNNGLNPYCKECARGKGRAYYAANPDKIKIANDKWVSQNKDKVLDRQRRFRKENPGYDVQWRLGNLYNVRKSARARTAEARLNPRARLDNAISCSIRGSLARGLKRGQKWESIVGYDSDELMRHLERRFEPGMTWENYGKRGWHVDHVIPKSIFNYTDPSHIDFRRCWSLSNLQPMWAIENQSKNNNYDKPFQPSLAI